mmetsp:Transcript_24773/g.32364  ORF Transcript_24773/g.32364 Transcript_24773/m.32364 type:complete len:259 (+) Transcript_24773:214-990(+)|eukprot:CAMPEP_0117762370 /NCGR_PEP_ID=MMETSP0947-20121206/17894_1 /TAXON_ID=44440 /ORGANISM="Chattonella subsalsa, Strain CCMP2191" /LENGTH=258 /DNA_ID=CAMNT_0005583657 /DNA_START=142 /DNA_END=918 /DNA_ORIENTATION=-
MKQNKLSKSSQSSKCDFQNDSRRQETKPTFFELVQPCNEPLSHEQFHSENSEDIQFCRKINSISPPISTLNYKTKRQHLIKSLPPPIVLTNQDSDSDGSGNLLDFLDEAAEDCRRREEAKNRTPSPSDRLQTKGENYWKLGHFAPKPKKKYNRRGMDMDSDSDQEDANVLSSHMARSRGSRQRQDHVRTQLCFNMMTDLDEEGNLNTTRNEENSLEAQGNARVRPADDLEDTNEPYQQIFDHDFFDDQQSDLSADEIF